MVMACNGSDGKYLVMDNEFRDIALERSDERDELEEMDDEVQE